MTKSIFEEAEERDAAISAAAHEIIEVIGGGFGAWKVPTKENCFDGIVEGVPPKEARERMIEEALAERLVWKPSDAALALVEKLKVGIGHDVLVEPWSESMWTLAADGPYPIVGRCVDVIVKEDADGFSQAYLKLRGPREVSYPAGSPSLREYLQSEGGGRTYLCNVGKLFRVMILGSRAL